MPRAIVPCAKSHGGVKTPPYKTNLKRPPCVKGAGCAIAQTGGLWPYGDKSMYGQGHNPSVTASPCHLPLHKGGVLRLIKLQFQLHAVDPGCGFGVVGLCSGKAGGRVCDGGAVMGQPQAAHHGFVGQGTDFPAGGVAV